MIEGVDVNSGCVDVFTAAMTGLLLCGEHCILNTNANRVDENRNASKAHNDSFTLHRR